MANSLGEIIRSKREASGLSITQLATQVGVSRPYLSRLERGIYAHPSISILGQVAKRLEIRDEDLYALTGYMRPAELPSFGPYLRAKHPDWPESARAELAEFYDFLRHKYSGK